MDTENIAFLQKTIEVWQTDYKRKLTLEDARQITENITGFFNTLLEWENNEKNLFEDAKKIDNYCITKSNHKRR